MNKHEIFCENCDKKKKDSLLLNKENIGWSKTTDYNGDPLYFCSKNCKSNYVLTEVLPLFNENRQKIMTLEQNIRHISNKILEKDDNDNSKIYFQTQLDNNMEKLEELKGYDRHMKNAFPSILKGGMRGGATEITDNTLEKKLIDATAPYNEKAARNAENFAKASIEVGKAILDQLKLDPRTFIDKAKKLGIKITEITKEGIFLLFPGDASMGESVDKLIKSGTKLYFLPVRILGTIAITIFLSMFDVFIPLKFLEKIPGLKPFIDLIMKYTAIIPSILKNLKIPNLSFGSLIDSDVMDASFLRKGSKYEYKPTKNTEGGRKKKRRTRRKKRRKN